jgi:DNA-binding CsgD family transcriptional regulator
MNQSHQSVSATGLTATLLASRDADEVHRTLKAVGMPWLFWQVYRPETVGTWDRFPTGFFEHYYGTDADRNCAVANAVRDQWALFTFGEAREWGGDSPEAHAAERVWTAFGIRDGIVLQGGRGPRRSITVIGLDRSEGAARLVETYGDALSAAAARLDRFLLESDALIEISRRSVPLSEAMQAVLRIQIEHPEMTAQEQADALDISPRMLEKRHAQIAKRFGVSSFAGAVAMAVRSPARYGAAVDEPGG